MDRVIMWIMAIGALIGGIDRILGNRFGLGKKFEEGFMLMGSTALSMAGIICLVPLLSSLIRAGLSAAFSAIGLDPAILGGLIAIDMGGYQLAVELAQDARIGSFAGIIVSAILGCTISFTIPIGMGMLADDARRDFSRGMIFGLAAMPAALLIGGLLCGIPILMLILQCLPILLVSILLLLGIWKKPDSMIRGFSVFARAISVLTTVGLALGAFAYMTGVSILPGLAPLEDAMAVVASIAIVMLGSLPLAELMQRALRKPLARLGEKSGMNSASIAGLIIGAVSVLPAITLVKDMDRRGRIVNAACMVCTASAFAAHLGFTAGVNRSMILPLLAAKFTGGILGAVIALAATRNKTAV